MHDPSLAEADPEIAECIADEERRQHEKLRLIPSENYATKAVMEACGSVLNNKYSEGYAGKRYYEGQQSIDKVERLAIERLKKLYGVDHANVQPYSGSPANLAVYFAFCSPGDTIMGMGLPSGGHLTHGWKVSISGKRSDLVEVDAVVVSAHPVLNRVEVLAADRDLPPVREMTAAWKAHAHDRVARVTEGEIDG